MLRQLILLLASVTPSLGADVVPHPCVSAPVVAPVIDPYRPPACRWCAGNRGLDYGTTPGMTVRSAAGGIVDFAGSVAGVRYVVVAHGGGVRTTYGRLGAVSVRAGEPVRRGTAVGTTLGSLHFGVRLGARYADPADFLVRVVRRARLVPLEGRPRPSRRTGLTCTAREGRR